MNYTLNACLGMSGILLDERLRQKYMNFYSTFQQRTKTYMAQVYSDYKIRKYESDFPWILKVIDLFKNINFDLFSICGDPNKGDLYKGKDIVMNCITDNKLDQRKIEKLFGDDYPEVYEIIASYYVGNEYNFFRKRSVFTEIYNKLKQFINLGDVISVINGYQIDSVMKFINMYNVLALNNMLKINKDLKSDFNEIISEYKSLIDEDLLKKNLIITTKEECLAQFDIINFLSKNIKDPKTIDIIKSSFLNVDRIKDYYTFVERMEKFKDIEDVPWDQLDQNTWTYGGKKLEFNEINEAHGFLNFKAPECKDNLKNAYKDMYVDTYCKLIILNCLRENKKIEFPWTKEFLINFLDTCDVNKKEYKEYYKFAKNSIEMNDDMLFRIGIYIIYHTKDLDLPKFGTKYKVATNKFEEFLCLLKTSYAMYITFSIDKQLTTYFNGPGTNAAINFIASRDENNNYTCSDKLLDNEFKDYRLLKFWYDVCGINLPLVS